MIVASRMEKRKRQNAKKVVWDFIQIAQGREKEGHKS